MNVYMNGYKKRSWNRSLLRGGTDVERTYITDDLRETLNHFALTRSNQKIREESDRIYKALKADIQDVMDGKDDIRIMRVVDRKIGKTYAPVSYTHLRAHETRHDLVCRLLLEKKKDLERRRVRLQ